MHDCKNFYRACFNAIYDDIVWVGYQFPRAGNSSSSVQMRMMWKLGDDVVDVVVKLQRRRLVALRDIREYCGQIFLRFSLPSNRQHGHQAGL